MYTVCDGEGGSYLSMGLFGCDWNFYNSDFVTCIPLSLALLLRNSAVTTTPILYRLLYWLCRYQSFMDDNAANCRNAGARASAYLSGTICHMDPPRDGALVQMFFDIADAAPVDSEQYSGSDAYIVQRSMR